MSKESPNVIVITGEAKVRAAIDVATITVRVVEKSADVAAAQEAASVRAAKVIEAIEAAGVSKRDYQSSFEMGDWHENVWRGRAPNRHREAVLKGKQITYTISFSLRKLEALSSTIAAIAAAKADSISSPQYSTSRMSELLDEARVAAAGAARRKIDVYAKAMGFRVLGLRKMSERTAVVGEEQYIGKTSVYAAAPEAAAPAVGVGTNQLGLTVSCEFVVSDFRRGLFGGVTASSRRKQRRV